MNKILTGDCLVRLRALKDCSVDSLVCDPPAGIGFMSGGKRDHWDSDKGGRDQWIAWLAEVMRECYRVMKPGAHGFVWALPRTSHWTATALEDAGFEVRDVITHLFGSGFPKSMCVSKALDKKAGAKRRTVGYAEPFGREGRKSDGFNVNAYGAGMGIKGGAQAVTAPATAAAKKWQGFGTNLKPASEHWVLIRKPLAAKNIADNVLTFGTGAINVDASRISTKEVFGGGAKMSSSGKTVNKYGSYEKDGFKASTQGRFPSNLLLSHHSACIQVGMKRVQSNFSNKGQAKNSKSAFDGGKSRKLIKYGGKDGTETVPAWQCDESCPVKEIDRQSGPCKTGNIKPRINNKSLFCRSANKAVSFQTDEPTGASRFFKTFQPEVKRAKRR